MSKKSFSIIIATFNRANYIGKTLNTILAQKYENWEIIIIDDGCTDETSKVLMPYLADKRITFHKRPDTFNKGCPGSRNFGLTRASGDFIWFFDDDDLAHPDLLKICAEKLRNEEDDFFRFEREIFYNEEKVSFEPVRDFESRRISKNNLKQMITGEIPFNSCQVIWKRDALGKDHFNDKILYADDWEFYSRLLAKGLTGISITKTLLYARKHPGSSTAKYHSRNKKIMNSVVDSHRSVIDIAINEGILDASLFQFFVRKSLMFRSPNILNHLLEKSNVGIFKYLKYKIGYKIYPILRKYYKFRTKSR